MFIKSIPGPGAGDRKSRKPRAPRPRVLIRHGISKGLSAGCAPSPCVCARCGQARGQLQVPQVRCRRCEGTSSFPRGSSTEEAACQCRRHKRCGFDPWVGKIPLRRAWQPTPVFLPVGFPWTEEPDGLQPWGRKESDTTEATQHAFPNSFGYRDCSGNIPERVGLHSGILNLESPGSRWTEFRGSGNLD